MNAVCHLPLCSTYRRPERERARESESERKRKREKEKEKERVSLLHLRHLKESFELREERHSQISLRSKSKMGKIRFPLPLVALEQAGEEDQHVKLK